MPRNAARVCRHADIMMIASVGELRKIPLKKEKDATLDLKANLFYLSVSLTHSVMVAWLVRSVTFARSLASSRSRPKEFYGELRKIPHKKWRMQRWISKHRSGFLFFRITAMVAWLRRSFTFCSLARSLAFARSHAQFFFARSLASSHSLPKESHGFCP